MHESRPSLTAERAAMRRAAHQVLDDPKVFDDPLALRIIGGESASAIQDEGAETPWSRYLRAFVAARSRYAEDVLRQAIENGAGQYVVLGAGLDTFAYRNPYPASRLRVFEVDHPATQAWKHFRLEQAGIPIPASLSFAPLDFEKQTLAEGLQAAGFDAGKPGFFSWLGVVGYLTREAVTATLRCIVSLPPGGSGVVFDYGTSPDLLPPTRRLVFDVLARRVETAGEPWRTFFDPAELAGELRSLGFSHVEDLGPEAINRRYFQGRQDGLQVGGLGHLMRAEV